MGGITCIGVLKSIRNQLGKETGDAILVTVKRDDSTRTVAIPPELAAAFKDNPDAAQVFDKLSYSHQREHVGHIVEAKKLETRRRRAARTVETLTG
jgi:uncharacterized protein YdeI (YjbR/CyaY-like superfamily)